MVYVNWQPFLDKCFQTGFDNYWKTNKIPMNIPTLYSKARITIIKKCLVFLARHFLTQR